MIIENGRPNPDDAEEILEYLIAGAEEAFGREFEEEHALVLKRFYRPVAEYFAGQQGDIADVLDSIQIDYATGDALDNLTSLIGVSRRPARPSAGYAQFSRDGPTPRTYSIPESTTVQTDANSPVHFSTTAARALSRYDNFEDGDIAEYLGDTGSFQAQQSVVYAGDYSLEATASGIILNSDKSIYRGSVNHSRIRATSGGSAYVLYGLQDIDNTYAVGIDESTDTFELYATDGGTETTIASDTLNIPADEWLHVEWEWKYDDNFEARLYDSTGSQLSEISGSDSNSLYRSGSIGFRSGSSNNVYFDDYAQSTAGAPIIAANGGEQTNVGSNTITVLSNDPTGIESVTNWIPATGGRDAEDDESLRERAKQQLSSGASASLPALLSALRDADSDVRSVDIIENDSSSQDAAGRPAHTFEPVVEAPSTSYQSIAEAIVETKAAGTVSVGGYAATEVTETVTLDNGDDKQISFSTADGVQIYIDISLEKTDEYEGNDAVRDNIVSYIGGTLADGGSLQGELGVSDDVIYNKVMGAVVEIRGVHDVSVLEVDTSSSPTGTSNITIGSDENAFVDATDGTIDITTSQA